MSAEPEMLNYKELLDELESGGENHLLLGNGFNNSLGVVTSFKNIFQKMKTHYRVYRNIESQMDEKNYDIEIWLASFKSQEKSPEYENFIDEYIEAKIKLDFMKAVYEIVFIKYQKVYAEKSIYQLFEKFQNFFTTNYDPFLYLLLMKYKDDHKDNLKDEYKNQLTLQGFSPTITEDEIYKAVGRAVNRGEMSTSVGEEPTVIEKLTDAPKQKVKYFMYQNYEDKIDNEEWGKSEIDDAVNKYFISLKNDNKEKENTIDLLVDDGFREKGNKNIFVFSKNKAYSQNVFFLHGAFHITINNNEILKITQIQKYTFRDKLNEVLNNQTEEIIAVLAGESDDKLKQIKNNPYLKHCFDKLGRIAGNVVIFGSSLAENDAHIFEALRENENIKTIYISTSEEGLSKTKEAAEKKFADKHVKYFNYKTVDFYTSAQTEDQPKQTGTTQSSPSLPLFDPIDGQNS